jgi:hypothetical protein
MAANLAFRYLMAYLDRTLEGLMFEMKFLVCAIESLEATTVAVSGLSLDCIPKRPRAVSKVTECKLFAEFRLE